MEKQGSAKENIIPCSKSNEFTSLINGYAEDLRKAAFSIGSHGMNEEQFIQSGLFDAAIERLRGQKAARTSTKYQFIMNILKHMHEQGAIQNWTSTGSEGRMDFRVEHIDGYETAIEAKGCLDGNNTTIFERPAYADELVVWSLCQNTGSDPKKNAWSGLHTRLGVEMISNPHKKVDAVIIWDELCGTTGRPCPKSEIVSSLNIPAPCVYLFPSEAPSVDNPYPACHPPEAIRLISAMKSVFQFSYANMFNLRIMIHGDKDSYSRQTFLSRLSPDGKDEIAYAPSNISKIKR